MFPTPTSLPGSAMPARVGQRAQITAIIRSAASRTGVDFAYLLGQARVESSLNPAARARTSSATGLYQFVNQTWLATVARHGADHGLGWAAAAITRGRDGRYSVEDPAMRQTILDLRRDPASAAAMAAAFAADNRHTLETRLGHTVEGVDLYLAHFLGAGGATRFLSAHDANPDAAAADLFPAAARANHAIFYAGGRARSLGEVRTLFARRLGLGDQGGGPVRTDAAPLMADGMPLSATPPDVSSAALLANRAAARAGQAMAPGAAEPVAAARRGLATLAYMTLARLGG